LIAFFRHSQKKPDFFRDSTDLLAATLEAKREARASVHARNTSPAQMRLTTAKGYMHRLTVNPAMRRHLGPSQCMHNVIKVASYWTNIQ